MDRIAERLRSGVALRPGEVATATGLSVRYIQRLMEKGALTFVRATDGGERRIPAHDALQLAERVRARLAG